jgi:mRNA-degrading endonuclease RelE of RelBE toxin-antitoxin system
MMAPPFSVRTTPHFERLFRRLVKGHAELVSRYADAVRILAQDPYNRSRRHQIIKLQGISEGEGQYRLRIRRWRFRYDIIGQDVVLHSCSLRREDTYR